MKSNDGKVWYGVGIDTTELKQDAEKVRREFKGMGSTAETEGANMQNALKKAALGFGAILTIQQALRFASSVAKVRGEFQSLEVAFETMLGSKAKADALMQQMVTTAATTPFDLQSVAGGAKQLLAYGFAAEEVNETLIRLGDVASALNIPLGDMTYLYGTTMTQGRLYTKDLLQFMGRGIPVAEELANQFGVQKDKIREMVEAGKVGFPEIKKAFESMTNEGGKFHNLMAKTSKTITGQISNLGDAFSIMMNDIGKSNQGLISGTLSTTINLVENYKKVGEVLAVLIATYGTYRAALMAAAAISKLAAIGTFAKEYLVMGRALGFATANQIAFNTASLANPYALAAAAVVALSYGIYKLATHQSDLTKATQEYQMQSMLAKREAKDLLDIIQQSEKGSAQYTKAIAALKDKYAELLPTLLDEKGHLKDIGEARIALNRAIEQSIGLKVKEAAITEAQTEHIEKQSKTYERMVSTLISAGLSESAARIKAQEFTAGVDKGDSVGKLTRFLLSGAAKRVNMSSFYKYIEQNNDMLTAVSDINKKFEFITGAPKTAGTTEPVFIEITQQIDETTTKIARLQQAIRDLRSGKTKSAKPLDDIKALNEEIETAKAELLTLTGQSNKDIAAQVKERQEAIAELEAQAREFSLNEERNHQAAMLAYQEESLIKKLDMAKVGLENEIATIDERKRKTLELLSAKEGKPVLKLTGEELTQDTALRNNAKEKYEAETKSIREDASNNIREIIADATERNLESLQKETNAINEHYDNLKLKLEQLNGSKEDAATIEQERTKAIIATETDHALERTRIEEDLQAKAAEYADGWMEKQVEVQRLVLQSAIEGATKRRKILEDEQQATGRDNSVAIQQDGFVIKSATLELQKLNEVARESMMGTIQNSVMTLAGSLRTLGGAFEGIGNILEGASGNIGNMMVGLKKSATTGEKISAGVSAASSIFSMIGNQLAENKKMQDAWNASIAEAAHQAALARIELDAYKESNLFGVENPYSRAIAGAKQYGTSMIELQKQAAQLEGGKIQTGTKKVVSGMNIATGAAAGAALGTIVPGVGNLIGGVVGGIVGGLIGLFTKKTIPVFQSLKKQYGEIYDNETFELNPKILEDYSKLDAETKKLVDNWKAIKDKAKAAQDEMRQNFKDLAGEMGSKLSEVLVNAFKDGKTYDAVDNYKRYVFDTIGEIVEQLIFAKYFEGLFKELEGRFNDSFGKNGDQDIVDDMTWFLDNYASQVDGYYEAMKKAKEASKLKGVELWTGESTRQAASKGIAAASQSSVEELNGRFAVIQEHTRSIVANTKELTENSRQQLIETKAIRANTARLEKIESEMGSVRIGIETINLKGITIKR